MTIRVHTTWSKSNEGEPGFTKGWAFSSRRSACSSSASRSPRTRASRSSGNAGKGRSPRSPSASSADRSSRRTGESQSLYRARTKSGGKSYIYTVRYTPAGGESIEFDTLATWRYEGKVGDRVKLIYFPEDPDGAEIDNVKQVWLPLATGLTVGTVCLVGGLMLVRLGRRQAAAVAAVA
jgi:hypothetical protein